MFSAALARLAHKGVAALGAAALLGTVLPGCAPTEETDEDAIVVGLLLPFTGSSSATASNFERAALYAADRINDGGGVHGRRVRVVARDTHSDIERSKDSLEELLAEGAVVVLGPESSEIAAELLPIMKESEAVFLSPLVGAATDTGSDCEHPWFRLAPSARALGEALGKQLSAKQAGRTAVLYAAGAYNDALRTSLKSRYTTLGGDVVLELALDPNAQSYGASIQRVVAEQVESVVLATSPRTAALLINEFDALHGSRPRWFLSPLLKTDLLVQNVAPAALEGAIGVAPKIYDRTAAFPSAFAERWLGDQPLEGAYFYYDAVGLVAMALQRSEPSEHGAIDHQSLEAALLEAAAPPGEAAGWDEMEVGLERLRDGDDIYYSGLTGPLLLERCGPRRLGASSTWTVQSGSIVDDTE